jgi:hypothetical protein
MGTIPRARGSASVGRRTLGVEGYNFILHHFIRDPWHLACESASRRVGRVVVLSVAARPCAHDACDAWVDHHAKNEAKDGNDVCEHLGAQARATLLPDLFAQEEEGILVQRCVPCGSHVGGIYTWFLCTIIFNPSFLANLDRCG